MTNDDIMLAEKRLRLPKDIKLNISGGNFPLSLYRTLYLVLIFCRGGELDESSCI